MQVSSTLNSISGIATSSLIEDKSVSSDYIDIVKQLFHADPYQTRDELNASDTELSKFKEDLKTKGSAQLLKDLNQDKIDALVEKYRQKLLKEKEAHPDKPMDIDTMVSDFKKQLLKEIEEAQKAEQKLKDNTQSVPLSTSDVLTGIKMSQDTEKASNNVLGFLEQMLNPNHDATSKKESVLL
jgi:hypothetical protein